MKGIIPAGTYNNQNEDIQTICMPTFLICDKDMDEQLVYEITKLMIENEDYLCSQHSCFEAMNDDTVAAGLSIPMHPGAERYFKEVGILK